MLKYLVQLTDDLMSAGIIIGMLYSYIKHHYGKRGRNILLIGGGAAIVAAAVMAVLKNATAKINIGHWNLIAFFTFIGAMLIFFIFSINPLRKALRTAGEYILYLSGAVIVLSLVFYSLPDVLAYPFNFDLQGNSVLSTDFLYRLIGCVLGFLLVLLTGIAAYKSFKTLSKKLSVIFLGAAMLINGFSFFGKAIQIMVTRRMIGRNQTFSTIIRIALNYSEYFIMAVLLAALVAAVYQFVRNTKVHEEYSNPAQHRKIRARMRNQRRWSVVLVVCAILAVINLTVIDAYNNKKPELSPVEYCDVDGDNVYVSFDQVSDGHLHRFGYLTDDNIEVRFIVIKKPNSSAYGIGLDACDICGEAGYFERGGQVVCKKCDVVMNINTIGFKGGCNPIVIDYKIEDGKIIVPIEELVKNKGNFD